MNKLEQNVAESFKLAKNDILRLQNAMINISQIQEKMLEMFNELNEKEQTLYQRMQKLNATPRRIVQRKNIIKEVKTIQRKAKQTFVATKGGKKFHLTTCPFAKNIKPKNKVKLSSKVKALNEGFKPCQCVN